MARGRRERDFGLKGPERPTALADALSGWIRRSGMRKRLELAEVIEMWPELVGPQIAAVTEAVSVSPDGTLLVRVKSPGWATELGLMTPRILARVNGSKAGRIKHVRWMVGRFDRS